MRRVAAPTRAAGAGTREPEFERRWVPFPAAAAGARIRAEAGCLPRSRSSFGGLPPPKDIGIFPRLANDGFNDLGPINVGRFAKAPYYRWIDLEYMGDDSDMWIYHHGFDISQEASDSSATSFTHNADASVPTNGHSDVVERCIDAEASKDIVGSFFSVGLGLPGDCHVRTTARPCFGGIL